MLSFNDFFIPESSKKLLKKWIKEDYKNKPLCIYGENGIGKTRLANTILSEYKIINIDVDFIKTSKNLCEYLDLSLGKKNICMMFKKSNENIYKSVIFDDIKDINNYDKSLFKDIVSWYKKYKNTYKNNPVIYIVSNKDINKKNYKELIDNCFTYELKYNDKNFYKLTNNILKNEKLLISLDQINNLIKTSNKNINDLLSNIEILKTNNTLNDNNKKDFNGEINEITRKIMNNDFDIDNILINSINDYNIISLNILDNLDILVNKNKDTINKYLYIYNSICTGDKYNHNMIINHNYDLLEYIIMQQLLFPIYKIKNNNIKIDILNYNKYISKSIYYISNHNIYLKYSYNIYDIYNELYLLSSGEKSDIKDTKILEKFIKIFNWIYNKNIKKNVIL